MAKRGRPRVSLGKSLEALLLSRSFTIDGNVVEIEDNSRIANAISLWLLTLKDISKRYGLERVYSAANLQRCASRLAGSDVGVLSDSLDQLLASLRTWSPVMGDQRFRSYKDWFLRPGVDPVTTELVWPLLTYYFRCGFSAKVYADLNTVFQFWKRLTLKEATWAEEECLESVLLMEKQMASWTYPADILDELRTIITKWLMGIDLTLTPRHSNGATAEVPRGRGQAAKFHLQHDYSNHEMMGALSGYGVHPAVNDYPHTTGFSEQPAVFQPVPKGIRKKRGISMEPTANQFWQNAVAEKLSEWFSQHREIHVNLRNQELSRQKCLVGSGRYCYATIDLSNASDTVTWKLVKEIFSNTTLLTLLTLVRTQSVRVSGRILQLAKYAPMGSALCFPIECLVFASVAQLSCQRSGCTPDFQVYGDDIVIPSQAYRECCKLLESLHFTVNTEKSYGPYSSFLEACGMESFQGSDVTPCRISRWWDIVSLRTGQSPASLEGSIVFSNKLFDYCLFETRRYVVQDILSHYDSVPFSVNPERGIYHPNPSNQHLRCRRNPDTQEPQYLIHRTVSNCGKGPDDIRYQLVLERLSKTERESLMDPMDRIDLSAGSTYTTLKKRWCDQLDFL